LNRRHQPRKDLRTPIVAKTSRRHQPRKSTQADLSGLIWSLSMYAEPFSRFNDGLQPAATAILDLFSLGTWPDNYTGFGTADGEAFTRYT
jgi:hypothetical protein